MKPETIKPPESRASAATACWAAHSASVERIETGDRADDTTDNVSILIWWSQDEDATSVQIEVPKGSFALRDQLQIDIRKIV